jgi:hypothetical protein
MQYPLATTSLKTFLLPDVLLTPREGDPTPPDFALICIPPEMIPHALHLWHLLGRRGF